MEFCEKCGALMFPKKEEDQKGIVLKCRECGFEKVLKANPPYTVEYRIKHSPREKIVVVEEESHHEDELSEDERRERRKEILEYYEVDGEE